MDFASMLNIAAATCNGRFFPSGPVRAVRLFQNAQTPFSLYRVGFSVRLKAVFLKIPHPALVRLDGPEAAPRPGGFRAPCPREQTRRYSLCVQQAVLLMTARRAQGTSPQGRSPA
jgi:hypothetical protein